MPFRALSRRSLRSLEGGCDDVRDVFAGRCSRSTRSISSSFVSRCKSLRSIATGIHRFTSLTRGWVITEDGLDLLDVAAFGVTDSSGFTISDVGADKLVAFDAQTDVTLQGLAETVIDDSDFLFT